MEYRVGEIMENTVLVTGAGGSIGSVVVKELLKLKFVTVKAFDIDEYSLSKLVANLNNAGLGGIRTCVGDIKDRHEVEFAVRDCDLIIHAAAVKMVDISNSNPIPCLKTNVDGTVNLVLEALRQETKRFLLISSDKAVDFRSIYGVTKFIGERLILWANSLGIGQFSACRLGNVIETRGNVFEIWREQKGKDEALTVTHQGMERYFWHVEEAVSFILRMLEIMKGGEIFIPKMTLSSVIELAKGISPNIKLVGIRPGEVLKAKLYSDYEKDLLQDYGDFWVIRE